MIIPNTVEVGTLNSNRTYNFIFDKSWLNEEGFFDRLALGWSDFVDS